MQALWDDVWSTIERVFNFPQPVAPQKRVLALLATLVGLWFVIFLPLMLWWGRFGYLLFLVSLLVGLSLSWGTILEAVRHRRQISERDKDRGHDIDRILIQGQVDFTREQLVQMTNVQLEGLRQGGFLGGEQIKYLMEIGRLRMDYHDRDKDRVFQAEKSDWEHRHAIDFERAMWELDQQRLGVTQPHNLQREAIKLQGDLTSLILAAWEKSEKDPSFATTFSQFRGVMQESQNTVNAFVNDILKGTPMTEAEFSKRYQDTAGAVFNFADKVVGRL